MSPIEPFLPATRDDVQRRVIVRRIWWIVSSVLGALLIQLVATAAVIPVPGAMTRNAEGVLTLTGVGAGVWLGALLTSGLFWFRRRLPLLTLGGATLMVVVLQLDGTMAMLTGASLLAHWQSRWRWLAFGYSALLIVVVVIRDWLRGDDALLARVGDGILTTPGAIIASIVIGLLAIGFALGYGIVVRARQQATAATGTADRYQQLATGLTEQLDDADRRTELSQAMHDTVAKTLTHASLQAAALRSSETLPPELRDSADAISSQVRQAMLELQQVQFAFQSDTPSRPAPSPLPDRGIGDLPTLIDELRASRPDMQGDVLILGRTPLALAVDRSAYWIASEALLNAAKHSRGPIHVRVRADDARGIELTVSNPVAESTDAIGTGRGLHIVESRAKTVGGWTRSGVEAGQFVFTAWLPWTPGVDVGG